MEDTRSLYSFNTNADRLQYRIYKTFCALKLRLVFSRFFDIRGSLGNVKEKPTRKTCFCREMKRLALRIYLAKFCSAAFLWCQRNFYCNFIRKRCWNGGEYVKIFKNESLSVGKILRSAEIKFIAETQCYACRETQLWVATVYL